MYKNDPRDFGASQRGIRAQVYEYLGSSGFGVHKFGFDTSFTAQCQDLGTRIPKTRCGTGLDHASIVHFDDLSCEVCDTCMFMLNMCDSNV